MSLSEFEVRLSVCCLCVAQVVRVCVFMLFVCVSVHVCVLSGACVRVSCLQKKNTQCDGLAAQCFFFHVTCHIVVVRHFHLDRCSPPRLPWSSPQDVPPPPSHTMRGQEHHRINERTHDASNGMLVLVRK